MSSPILAKIKQTYLEARKKRVTEAVNVLSTLINEATMIGKNDGNREPTDVEVIASIKKMMKSLHETLNFATSQEQKRQLTTEIAVIATFLPKQLTNEELVEEINMIVTEIGATTLKDMGKVMKALKEKHEGSFDGNAASGLVRQKLSS